MWNVETVLLAVIIGELSGIAFVLWKILDKLEGPKYEVDADPRYKLGELSLADRGEITEAAVSTTLDDIGRSSAALREYGGPMFGSMTDDERRARRREHRIANCKHHGPYADRLAEGSIAAEARTITCVFCSGVAPIEHNTDGKRRLGDFK